MIWLGSESRIRLRSARAVELLTATIGSQPEFTNIGARQAAGALRIGAARARELLAAEGAIARDVSLRTVQHSGGTNVPKSVLEAIKLGQWDFEPEQIAQQEFEATGAMPGTKDKLEVLAARARQGLPLWHTKDRTDYDDRQDA